MTTQTYSYGGYEIPIRFMPPFWQAEIHPAAPGVPPVDRTEPIRATNIGEAYLIAQSVIDQTLRQYTGELFRETLH